jgi:single-strand DNA-binding protein
MSARSLNKVILIGNLTRDPELRFTPSGTGVCTFGLATNRSWTTQSGELKEQTEFHKIVAWNKLGELCSQLLTKGRKVYVEGRLSSHSWVAPDGTQRSSTEVVIEDMIILDSKRVTATAEGTVPETQAPKETVSETAAPAVNSGDNIYSPEVKTASDDTKNKESAPSADRQRSKIKQKEKQEDKPAVAETHGNEDITPDDIPF